MVFLTFVFEFCRRTRACKRTLERNTKLVAEALARIVYGERVVCSHALFVTCCVLGSWL